MNFDAGTLVRDVINDGVEESAGKGKSCNNRHSTAADAY